MIHVLQGDVTPTHTIDTSGAAGLRGSHGDLALDAQLPVLLSRPLQPLKSPGRHPLPVARAAVLRVILLGVAVG